MLSNGGEDPGDLKICHKCDNPPCVRPDHLFIGTMKDNQSDMSRKGRAASGSRHGLKLHPDRISRGEHRPLSKLTYQSVLKMRDEYARGGISYKRLGMKYGVSEMAALKAVKGKSWKSA